MKINSKLDIVDKNSLKVNRPHRCPFILDIFHITMKYLECAPAADGSYVCTCKNWSGRDRSVVKNGGGKRWNEFTEWHVAWLAEWHNYAECKIWKMAQRNKLN